MNKGYVVTAQCISKSIQRYQTRSTFALYSGQVSTIEQIQDIFTIAAQGLNLQTNHYFIAIIVGYWLSGYSIILAGNSRKLWPSISEYLAFNFPWIMCWMACVHGFVARTESNIKSSFKAKTVVLIQVQGDVWRWLLNCQVTDNELGILIVLKLWDEDIQLGA